MPPSETFWSLAARSFSAFVSAGRQDHVCVHCDAVFHVPEAMKEHIRRVHGDNR